MAKPRPSSEVVRKVYFFKIDAGRDDSGEDVPFDPRPALRAIEALPFRDGGRYVDNGDGNTTCAWVDAPASEPRMRLATIRKTDFPQLETRGNLGGLVLPAGAGLAETIHAVFFAKNVVGADFNFHGPRASRLAWYLKKVAPVEAQAIQGMPWLLCADVYEQLARLDSLRRITITARPGYAATLQKEDRNLGAIMNAASEIQGAGQITASIAVERYARKAKLGSGMLAAIKRLVRGQKIPIELVSKFDVEGFNAETGKVEAVDLLREYLVAEVKMMRVDPKSRALVRETVYNGIRDSYAQLKGEITKAVSVS